MVRRDATGKEIRGFRLTNQADGTSRPINDDDVTRLEELGLVRQFSDYINNDTKILLNHDRVYKNLKNSRTAWRIFDKAGQSVDISTKKFVEQLFDIVLCDMSLIQTEAKASLFCLQICKTYY